MFHGRRLSAFSSRSSIDSRFLVVTIIPCLASPGAIHNLSCGGNKLSMSLIISQIFLTRSWSRPEDFHLADQTSEWRKNSISLQTSFDIITTLSSVPREVRLCEEREEAWQGAGHCIVLHWEYLVARSVGYNSGLWLLPGRVRCNGVNIFQSWENGEPPHLFSLGGRLSQLQQGEERIQEKDIRGVKQGRSFKFLL